MPRFCRRGDFDDDDILLMSRFCWHLYFDQCLCFLKILNQGNALLVSSGAAYYAVSEICQKRSKYLLKFLLFFILVWHCVRVVDYRSYVSSSLSHIFRVSSSHGPPRALPFVPVPLLKSSVVTIRAHFGQSGCVTKVFGRLGMNTLQSREPSSSWLASISVVTLPPTASRLPWFPLLHHPLHCPAVARWECCHG
jgi:hypothetical protein